MAGKAKRGLGKGLDSIIPENKEVKISSVTKQEEDTAEEGKVVLIRLTKIERDKEQPRKNFTEDELNELADSIKKHGVFQPLLVQKKDDYYEIVTGERRWRAAKIAGLKEVPCIIRSFTEQEKAEIQLIENLQRQDLNPIEEAMAYRRLLTEFNLKQDELAERIGKNRTTITNTMRLLNLSEDVRNMIIDEKLTPGHARPLLAIEDSELQYQIAQQVFDEKLSVRETEKLVNSLVKPKKEKKPTPEALQLIYRKLEDQIRDSIGAKVVINPKNEKRGKIEIEYFSQNELEEIVNKISK